MKFLNDRKTKLMNALCVPVALMILGVWYSIKINNQSEGKVGELGVFYTF